MSCVPHDQILSTETLHVEHRHNLTMEQDSGNGNELYLEPVYLTPAPSHWHQVPRCCSTRDHLDFMNMLMCH